MLNDKKLSKEEKLQKIKLHVKPIEAKVVQKLTEIEQTIPDPIKKSLQIHSVTGKKSNRP